MLPLGLPSGGRAFPAAGAACALIVALAACQAQRLPTEAVPAGPPTTASAAAPPTRGKPVAAAAPVSLTIPALGIRSTLVQLGLTKEGTLEVPTDFDRAGWYAGGPRPGEPGPAVIAGHVDSKTGPAVFYRLREIRTGDRIRVARQDGSADMFAVTDLRQYPKNAFPTADVYGPVPHRELRLITCAGVFDAERSTYRSNLVVFARLRVG